MFILLYIIVSVIYIWILLGGRYRHFTHMLQLNSYYNSRYGKYLAKNLRDVFDFKAILSLLAYAVIFFGSFPVISAYALIYLLLEEVFPKKKEKKPLVVTSRVKRLFVTEGIIIACLLSAGFFVIGPLRPVLFFAAAFISPLAVFFANVINAPIEYFIRRKFYKNAQEKLRAMDDLTVIGVTGSYGKTSVKNFLTELLSEKYTTLMTPQSFNTTLGVVRTVNENLTPRHEVFVVEMGARNVGDIKEICDLALPKAAVITSIGPQHLETFGSIENVIKTKFELCDAVGEGTKFLNYDNEYIRNAPKSGNIVTYGTTEDCDYYAKDITVSPYGSEFVLVTPNGEKKMRTKLLGVHNVVNLVGSAAVACVYGVSLDSIALAMNRIESVEHRLQLKKSQGCTIIDDAYNANPAGAKSALQTLSAFSGTRIVITPGLVELGEREEEENEKLGALCIECADHVIFVGEKQAAALMRGAEKVDGYAEKAVVAKDIYEAFDMMRQIPGEDKIVLLENDLPDNYL